MPTFVLIHSPLVGPMTWRAVADELRRRGFAAVVPSLAEASAGEGPFWAQHSAAVARAVDASHPMAPLMLVGHSGAGPMLPAVRQALDRHVAGYVVVDASLPRDGASRLDLFDSADEVAAFRSAAGGGFIAPWTEQQLRRAIPDEQTRARFVAELRPLPLDVYEEPLPVPKDWPDAPCGYLQFSATYDAPARAARARGWPVVEIDAHHFHMLVDPLGVAEALVEMLGRMKGKELAS